MSNHTFPPPPEHIGDTEGPKNDRFKVIDEIIQRDSHYAGKAIYLQKIQFVKDNRIELRPCYFIIGEKPSVKGKWVWGESAPMILPDDFSVLVSKAKEKGWF